MTLLTRVRRFVAQHHLAERGTRVVVAVSGGSDSVALAHIIHDLEAAGSLEAAGLVHFNHQLRDMAGRDEQLSVALARSFGWRFVVEREDIGARARRDRRSVEFAARAARYECFARARVALGGDVVALGHTRDDQAETVLLRLLRGAGPKGLAGIHPRNGTIVRPVLCCRRQELRQLLAGRGIAYVDDETNADVGIPRNRIRAELLPLLERRFNPAVVDALADQAELAREVWLWMEKSLPTDVCSLPAGSVPAGPSVSGPSRADFEVSAADVTVPPALELDVAALTVAPLALRRLAVWRAMTEAAGGRPISFAHVETVLQVLESGTEQSVDMPGHSVQRLGLRLVLRRRPAGGRRGQLAPPPNFFDYSLSIPGEVAVPEADCALAADWYPAGIGDLRMSGEMLSKKSSVAVVRGDLHVGDWRVRSRRSGDRFRPVGLGGHKKLQDLFVDHKVPRARRETVPLVVDEHDRIVWVAGFGIDEAFRVTDATQGVIMLRLKTLGGSA